MGALNPWGLLLGLSIIPIIYLYFIKQEKTILEVSSIIPWSRLEDDRSSSREKFSLDLLLLLQILVILAIVLMLARLYYLDIVKVNHRVLIMDASASMKTIESDGLPRLEKAKDAAIDLIEKMSVDDKIMIIRMSATPEKLTEFISDRNRLKNVIESIRAGDTHTNFRATLSLALSGIQGLEEGRIFIMGDRSQESNDVHHLISGVEKAGERLIFHTVGEIDDNVAITALDIYQSVYENIRKKIYITIRNYSSIIKNPVLKVFIGGKLVYRKQVNLHPNDYKILPFGNIKESGLLKVSIEDEDALMSDNTAYGVIRKNREMRLLLVTENEQFIEDIDRICKAAKSLQATPVFPDEFPNIDTNNFDIVLFHQNTPLKMPEINSVFIDPPSKSVLFAVSSEIKENPMIFDWNRKHQMLKYLNFLDAIPVTGAHLITPPLWANELISSRDFPLAFYGIYQDYKRAVFSFDLSEHFFPSSQDVTGLILFLNLIDWMAPAELSIQELKTGEKYLLEDKDDINELQIQKPDGTVVAVKQEEGGFSFGDTEMVGVYLVRVIKKDGTELERRFFTNLLDEHESRIKPTYPTKIPATLPTSTLGHQHKRQYEFWRYLLAAALLFLLAEWWVYFQRVE